MPGGKRQFEDAESAVADHEAPPPLNEGERLSMALRVNAVEARLAELAHAQSEIQAPPPTTPQSLPAPSRHEAEPQKIPARMLNEFVYCQRLFYYEFVEAVFVESADTLRGGALHQRVDSGSGALPAAKKKPKSDKKKVEDAAATSADPTSKEPETQNAEAETIHSRSVQMGSERLGVVAKMDLVESKTEKEDLFTA